jgi:hypothetical protein
METIRKEYFDDERARTLGWQAIDMMLGPQQ